MQSNTLCLCASGIIKLRRSPAPRLRGPQYVLNITATDDNASGGPSPLSSSAQVIVGINDINNNKPLFQDVSQLSASKSPVSVWSGPSKCPVSSSQCQNHSLNAAVLENQLPGTFVLRVQAHDADMGVNGEVKYGIMHRDGVSSGFNIDPDTGRFWEGLATTSLLRPVHRVAVVCVTGVITTATSFDRERQREYTLSVTATDQAEEPLIGICQISVVITDQNDNGPRFENSRYQCEYPSAAAVAASTVAGVERLTPSRIHPRPWNPG